MMRLLLVLLLTTLCGLAWAMQDQDAPLLEIIEPTAETILVGPSTLVARLDVEDAAVDRLTFSVDGREVCMRAAPPWSCDVDAGPEAGTRHVRVVARLTDGRRLVANVRTRRLEFVDRVQVDAVRVPVIVRDGRGEFVRGLTLDDFRLKEDGVAQSLASISSGDGPLDVVMAIDISESMTGVMTDVLEAASRFLGQLREQDTATVMAFNDQTFMIMDREADPGRRRLVAPNLKPWGGTALYDATLQALKLAQRGTGRKGVVIFSDGDDRSSRADGAGAIRRIQQSEVLVYTIAFGSGAADPVTRRQLDAYARESGGRVFFVRHVTHLDAAYAEILGELASQYVLSYEPRERLSGWRRLEVEVAQPGLRVRARDGYLATAH